MHAIDAAQITREGSRVTLRRLPMPRYPAAVMVQSATTLARVPASVERSPPLYVPLERRDDITLDRSERLTPAYCGKNFRHSPWCEIRHATPSVAKYKTFLHFNLNCKNVLYFDTEVVYHRRL